MASMRDIKRRKNSIASTGQITRAMKLVSTVKLQRAKSSAQANKFYFNLMFSTMQDIMASSEEMNHPYLKEQETDGKRTSAVILITSNRGLAGGYNNAVSKHVLEQLADENVKIYAIGRKGAEYMEHHGVSILKNDSDVINAPLYKDAMMITSDLLERFSSGEISRIYLAYTEFVNTVTHEPKLMQLLPVAPMTDEEIAEHQNKNPMNYDGEEMEMLSSLIPQYMASLIYGGMLSSVASENAARMQAMDNATSNAEEMIEHLELAYNRARQSSITQELTEIIGGADAINS
ncbi:MAG: ATP synthase F1 subunit gamma [Lachnospiraceae bacterium]|nr:ATP synthase F1 subunit gamma [Lachnospiraceae bacterium]